MDWLVRISYATRRAVFRGLPLIGVCAMAVGVVLDARSRLQLPWSAAAAAAWALLLSWRTVSLWRSRRSSAEVDVWLLVGVGLYAALGRLPEPLLVLAYPAVYVFVAAVAAFARPL